MKTVAIISAFPYHIECAGFLLDIFARRYEITIFTPAKTLGYELYFARIYDFQHRDISEFAINDYDYYVKLSANDKTNTPTDKTISIVHAAKCDGDSKHKIKLSPYVKIDAIQILPIYEGITMPRNEMTRRIIWIGQLEDNWIDDDMINFIKSVDYLFTFVISTGRGRGNKMRQLPNVTVINSLKTDEMINMINDSDFMICRKIPFQYMDRYSGCITLALSHNIPMIINRKFAIDYNIPAVTFDKEYSELVEQINDCDSNQRDAYINDIIEYKKITKEENKNKIIELISTP